MNKSSFGIFRESWLSAKSYCAFACIALWISSAEGLGAWMYVGMGLTSGTYAAYALIVSCI
jgi:hypothetical protein